jgi:hypothetical protein
MRSVISGLSGLSWGRWRRRTIEPVARPDATGACAELFEDPQDGIARGSQAAARPRTQHEPTRELP